MFGVEGSTVKGLTFNLLTYPTGTPKANNLLTLAYWPPVRVQRANFQPANLPYGNAKGEQRANLGLLATRARSTG
ncbi:hypothetical protein [Moorena producens]|uniref:hypothetical protein n=1 Tax=Moorena producens TaxID=1155739 RepID=UPI0011EA6F2A|nr:hypothetical protein [Moorena producens]